MESHNTYYMVTKDYIRSNAYNIVLSLTFMALFFSSLVTYVNNCLK